MKKNTDSEKQLPSQQPFGEAIDFLRLIWAVDHGLQKVSKQLQTEFGITSPQRMVVRIVGRFPSISAGQLAEILHLDPSTLTSLLKRLSTRGLLERKVDPKDRRRVQLGLTQKGRKLDEPIVTSVEAAVERLLQETPAEKLEAAREVLLRFSEILSPPSTEQKPEKP